ncbi:FAD/NAD(P)-binding domain-containing protein [Epithele typhae]|uniref:FAD/NAD(P)-binding domain-containing protein n=1 Tax=Epithele typhae TaxID=378194 RepID=UPI002008D6A1|nr:FAD/NAD(P)-binding domain-containing protein [Epithele typhae]KAH9917931.1 FAD/NAD(P)-binding domain-containing protein [Epithele typhae]
MTSEIAPHTTLVANSSSASHGYNQNTEQGHHRWLRRRWPILGMFLKMKGYEPVIYERNDAPSGLGLSLALQPNGLRVLQLIPGLLDEFPRGRVAQLISNSILPGDERELARADVSKLQATGSGFTAEGVRRSVLTSALAKGAEARGVPVRYGHHLVRFEEKEGSVVVHFANGATDEGSFLVGCDGLHSNTRVGLFGKEEATFTGLVQTGGISPIPQYFKDRDLRPMVNTYGDNMHFIAYTVNETQMSWAITEREEEAKETWRHMGDEQKQAVKQGRFSQLPSGVGEAVRTADTLVKYGIYDRPALTSWHKGRVVLIGDAAHPTSPHLGQGANQACEDVYHLVRLLQKHHPDPTAPPSTATLDDVFSALEALRIPRTSALVARARAQGESRVVSGVEACRARDARVVEQFKGLQGIDADSDEARAAVRAIYSDILDHPFKDGESEI